MEKKMKNDLKLKLKFLKFFYLHGVMPPSNFSPKMDNWGGGMSLRNMVINNFHYFIKKKKLKKFISIL